MVKRKRLEVPARLAGLEQQFAAWRKTRAKCERIPERLWKAAAKLAVEFGLSRTAKLLKVDYYHLKKRLDRYGVSSNRNPAFMEIPPVAFPSSGECVIEFDDGAGASMRVHLKGADLPDVLALGRSFWNAE